MVTKVLFRHSYYLWFEFCEGEFLFSYIISQASDAFTFAFEFAILWSSFTRKYNCLFCLHLFTFHFLRLKQKMDNLLFLIKRHNKNETAGYKWQTGLHHLLTKTNKMKHGIGYTTSSSTNGLTNYRTFSKHWGIKINKYKKALKWDKHQR